MHARDGHNGKSAGGIGAATETPQSTGRKRGGAAPKATGSCNESEIPDPAQNEPQPVLASIDNDALAIPKERYHRDKAHLKFVASQPCLICERSPQTPTICGSLSPARWDARSATSSPYHSAGPITGTTIALATNRPGGIDRPLIPSRRRENSGSRRDELNDAMGLSKKRYAGLLDTGRVEAWEIGLRSASRNGSAGIVLRWRLGDDVEVEVICVWPDGISVVVVLVVVRGDAMAATDCDPLIVFRISGKRSEMRGPREMRAASRTLATRPQQDCRAVRAKSCESL